PLLGEGFYLAELEFQLLLPVVLLGGWNLIHNHLLQLRERSYAVAVNQGMGLAIAALWLIPVWPDLGTVDLVAALLAGTVGATTVSHLQTRGMATAGLAWPRFLRLLPVAALVATGLLWWHPRGLLQAVAALSVTGPLYLLGGLALGGLAGEDLQLLRRALRKTNVR
ncbi:hypothetical protein ACFL59_02675, partial [Planctomycetota bacterium]